MNDQLSSYAVECAAVAYAESQKIDWEMLSSSQQKRRIRAMFVGVRAYLTALDSEMEEAA